MQIMTEEILIPFDGGLVKVKLRFHRTSHVTMRKLSSDGFSLSMPTYYKRNSQEVQKIAISLLEKFKISYEKSRAKYHGEKNWGENYCFLFGDKVEGDFSNKEDVLAFLKSHALPYITDRVAYYEKMMGISKPYKVRVRDMGTRYGSNSSKTHALSFAVSLICYSPDIIDSVVVHELAHFFEPNHSKRFYAVVYRYDPDYQISRKKLIKEIHK